MENSGWIKLHRKIEDHWVFRSEKYFKAWITILITVNHTEKRVLIGSEIFTCGVGESLLSLDTWATRFGAGWDKSATRRFFKLLQNDSMIVTKDIKKSTHLKVLQYSLYQETRNTDETQMKHKRNTNETQMTPTQEGEELKNKRMKEDKKTESDPNLQKLEELKNTQRKEPEIESVLQEFKEFRESIKKPLTPLAEIALRKSIWQAMLKENWSMQDIMHSIRESIMNGWQGVFLQRNKFSTSNPKSNEHHNSQTSNYSRSKPTYRTEKRDSGDRSGESNVSSDVWLSTKSKAMRSIKSIP